MADRKAVIKNADMSEEMQQDAVDCATQALEKYNIEKVSQNTWVIGYFKHWKQCVKGTKLFDFAGWFIIRFSHRILLHT